MSELHPPSIIFVTGAARSGTTMLSRILGNHCAIVGLNELHYFGDLFDPGQGAAPVSSGELESMATALLGRQNRTIYAKGVTEAERRQAKSICAGLTDSQRDGFSLFAAAVREFSSKAGKRIACEQTPRNIFYARQLLAAFPQARVVHIVRDPRAVLASQKNRWKLRRLGAGHLPWMETVRTWVNYHPITASKLWIKASATALQLRDHPRFMLTRFEDLVANPQREISAICSFLGLEFEPQMVEVNQWGSSNLQHELDKKGISKEVVDQWQASLSAGELAISDYLSAAVMQPLRYQVRSSIRTSALPALRYLLTYPAHLAGVVMANPRRAWIQLRATLQTRAHKG